MGSVQPTDNAVTAIVDKVGNLDELLRKSSHPFRGLFESMPISCYCFDVQGRIYGWNKASEKLYGLNTTEVVNKRLSESLCRDEDAGCAQATVASLVAGETFEGMEWKNRRADGTTVEVLSSGFPLRGPDQSVIGGIIVNVDITVRKQSEMKLQQSYEQLDVLVQERTRELKESNLTLQSEIIERKRAEASIRDEADRLATVISVQAEIARVELDLEKVMQLICDRTRSLLWADLCDIWLLDGPECVLRASSSIDVCPIGMRLSCDSNVIASCVRAGEIIHCRDAKADDHVDIGLSARTDSLSLLTVPIYFGSKIAGAFVAGIDVVDAFDESAVQMLQLMAGLISSAMEHSTQFEELRAVERELHRSLAQTEQLLVSIPCIFVGLDENRRVTTWNAEARTAFGISSDCAVGKPVLECGINWDPEVISEAINLCEKEGRSVQVEDVVLIADGKNRLLDIAITPISTAASVAMGYLILGTDVTDRRGLEGQLSQARKLESIGNLAAGISHEINTPIQYIGDNTRFVQTAFADLGALMKSVSDFIEVAAEEGVPDGLLQPLRSAAQKADIEYLMTEVPSAIEQSLEGVNRVAHIVAAMKEFSHPGTLERTPVDLNHALDSTVTVSRNEWKYVAEVVTDFDSELKLISCLPAELNQAFLNLIVNASHAIAAKIEPGEKGTITIRTRGIGDNVEIKISDTGAGIPEAILSRIFDPFFTTKPVGKGTGQGLAIARAAIVTKHDGSIECESELGQGTTFTIRLPIEDTAKLEKAA